MTDKMEEFKGPVRTCSGCSFMPVDFPGMIRQINTMDVDVVALKKKMEKKTSVQINKTNKKIAGSLFVKSQTLTFNK